MCLACTHVHTQKGIYTESIFHFTHDCLLFVIYLVTEMIRVSCDGRYS